MLRLLGRINQPHQYKVAVQRVGVFPANRRYSDNNKKDENDGDFPDERAKAEYEAIMQVIESSRQGSKITRPTLPKPQHGQRLRSAGAVNAVPRVKRLQGDLSEADTLPMTADPAGGAQQVLPDLPSVGLVRVAAATIPAENMAEAVRVYREMIGPAYKRTAGFKGGSLSLNREAGTMHSITYWASSQALENNNEHPQYQNAMRAFSKLVSEPPRVEQWSVCCAVHEDVHF